MGDKKLLENIASVLKLEPHILKSFSIEKLEGDASDRSYFRAKSKSDESYIIMKMAKGFNSPAEEITKTSKKIDQLPFLNIHRFLFNIGIRIPQIKGFNPQSAIIVLEDLGDKTLYSEFGSLKMDNLKMVYQNLIDEMIKFQKAAKPDFPCIAFYRKYDSEMCMWELEHFREWGIEVFLDKEVPFSERELINSFFEIISETFLREKFCFCHRDYHSKNIILKNDSINIIDFQDALLAPAQYDLASLLRDSYVKLDEEVIDSLVDYYVAKFGNIIDGKDFRRSLDMISIHRNLKAAGRFVFIERKKSNSNYIEYIPQTLENVKLNISKYEEFKKHKNILNRYIDEIIEKINREYVQ